MSVPTTTCRWIAAISACALLAIAGVYAGWPWLHYVFKPLTTLAIAAMVVATSRAEPAYRRAVIAGLVLSTAGDVFLMLPGDRFVYGLAAFLVAHVA